MFEGGAFKGSDFAFTREVADVFDDMLVRSGPFYLEQQAIIKDFAKRVYVPGTCVYDLGSFTSATLLNIAAELKDKNPRLIGYDNSMPMVEKARARVKDMQFDGMIDLGGHRVFFSGSAPSHPYFEYIGERVNRQTVNLA